MNAYEREMLVKYHRADLHAEGREARLAAAAHGTAKPAVQRVDAGIVTKPARALAAWLRRPAASSPAAAGPATAGGSVSGHLLPRAARLR
ncbi:MAG: hypothetical protein ACXVAE_00720 [Candidatus Limnocylindrales bacterium]